MRLFVAALAGLAIAGCTQTPTAAVSPIASPSPSPTANGAPVTDVPLSKVGFACRLPVTRVPQGGDYAVFQGGFITFPQATFHSDPAGVIRSDSTQQGLVTDSAPVLHGSGGVPFYDLAMKRWIPASPAQTSPDGAFYAYSTDPTRIHVVDVARGSDRVITIANPQGASIQIVDFEGGGVLFLYQSYHQSDGVWRLDVGSGSVSRVAQVGWVDMVRDGYAWVSAVDPRDTAPPQQANSRLLFDSLVRVDLATGARTLWFYAPGKAVFLRGLDHDGHPVLEVSPPPDFNYDGEDIRLVSGPGESGTEVFNGPMVLSNPQQDVGRLWFGNDRGIYLFTSPAGLRKVFAFAGSPPVGEFMQPAGFCL